MASPRASITKELLRESLESVLKPFKIHSLDDGKFSCVVEFLMGREVFVNRILRLHAYVRTYIYIYIYIAM